MMSEVDRRGNGWRLTRAFANIVFLNLGNNEMKLYLILLPFLLLSFNALPAAPKEISLFKPEDERKIVIHNRVLATVNDKSVTVYDLMKKMDLLFYRQFPQYTSSAAARYQFYNANWKAVLRDLIDKELIMADAEEVKMQVSNGDVRQEMETMFGPNIITNLDQVGLTFEEAWKMVHADIVIKRMLFSRANAKALKQITPIVIRDAYSNFAKENHRPETWNYAIITIRDPDQAKGAEAANQAHQLLISEKIPLNELSERLGKLTSIAPTTKINLSEPYSHTQEEMAESSRKILAELQAGQFSAPQSQTSRADGTTVYRIFFLQEKIAAGAPPFSQVSNNLKDKLVDEASNKEIDQYIARLRKHFDVQGGDLEALKKENFQPFELQ